MLKKFNRFQILISAVTVSNPFSVSASIIQIQHRSNSIDTKPVYVELFYPVDGISNEKIFDFIFSVIENLGPPIRVLPFSGIWVFVESLAVKIGQPMGILR